MLRFKKKYVIHIGGFVAMAVDPNEAYLLVVTHAGRGVFELASGKRIARDASVLYPSNGCILGIGPFSGQNVSVVEYDFETPCELVTQSNQYRIVAESSEIYVYQRRLTRCWK